MSTSPMYEGGPLARPNDDVEDQGLTFDIQTILTRRRLLGVLGVGAGSAALAACAPGGQSAPSSTAAATTSATASEGGGASESVELNTETAGPYPGDGSNGPDVLEESGIERRDLTSSIEGGGSITGTPMTLTMNLIDISNNNAPLTGTAVRRASTQCIRTA
ncbi:hypothetical protein [Corynebacterium sp. HMSC077D10]|uniref:hypothetical protein n=1 Tax=unclassified Corynebacterium TaxID=2624378 RepID=UPI00352B3DFF